MTFSQVILSCSEGLFWSTLGVLQWLAFLTESRNTPNLVTAREIPLTYWIRVGNVHRMRCRRLQ